MTTEAFLWAIFILLFVALVLQIIIARRGPWEKPPSDPLARTAERWERQGIPRSHIRIIRGDE